MPHAIQLHLTPTNGKVCLAHPSQYAHGLFYNILEQIDPSFSAEIHASKDKSFFTLWPKTSKHEVRLRITTLDDDVFKPLIQTLVAQSISGVALGQDKYQLSKVIATPEGDRDANAQTWDDIMAAPKTDRLNLQFLTPTAFATSRSDGKRHMTPLPLPRLVFGSLLRAYQRFSPQPYSDHWLAQLQLVFNEQLELRKFDTRSQMTWAGKQRFTGFVGKTEYIYQESAPEVREALGRLQALSFYAGIGAKTGYGLGQVRSLSPTVITRKTSVEKPKRRKVDNVSVK